MTSLVLSLRAIPKLLFKEYDLIVVGFFGQLLMIPLGIITRKKILFDAFISTYDTLIEDRRVGNRKSLLALFSRSLDRTSCNFADHILLDTKLHADYFADTFEIDREKFSVIPVGVNEDIFFPRVMKKRNEQTCVLFYCSFLPLHGVDVVIQAAEVLRDSPITFKLVGGGPTLPAIREMVKERDLPNILFLNEMPIEMIAEEICESDICLGGHFGLSAKANRVVPGKIYQMLAMERPIVAASTSANLQLLQDGKTAILCPPGDFQSIAHAILSLHENESLRKSIAKAGRELYEEQCSEKIISTQLYAIISEML